MVRQWNNWLCWRTVGVLNIRLELGGNGVGQVPHSLMECLCDLPWCVGV